MALVIGMESKHAELLIFWALIIITALLNIGTH